MIERALIAGLRKDGEIKYLLDLNAPGSWSHRWKTTPHRISAYFFYTSERQKALGAATKSIVGRDARLRGWTPCLFAIDYERVKDRQGRFNTVLLGCKQVYPLTALEQLAECAP